MSLGALELLVAIEDEFGIAFDETDLAAVTTVGDLYEVLKKYVGPNPPSQCMTQRCFYQLRKAIGENYRIPRSQIKLDSRLIDIIPHEYVKDGWLYLRLFTWLDLPPLSDCDTSTVRELVESLVVSNAEKFTAEPSSEEEVWQRFVLVFHGETGEPIESIRKSAKIGTDVLVD